jgi:hypothetical protein
MPDTPQKALAKKPVNVPKKLRGYPIPPKNALTILPMEQRVTVEKELVMGYKDINQISAETGISVKALHDWKRYVVLPSLKAHRMHAEDEARADQRRLDTRALIRMIEEELGDSLDAVKGRGIDEKGKPRKKESVRIHGNVPQLLGVAVNVARLMAEVNGEVGGKDPAGAQTTIKFISIPKIGEKAATAVEVTAGGATVQAIQAIQAISPAESES